MMLIPFALLFFQTLAFGKTLPWGLLPFEMGHWVWQLFSVLFLGLILKSNRESPAQFLRFLEKRQVLSSWVLLNLIYLSFSYLKFRDLGFQFPWWGMGVIFVGAFTADTKSKFNPVLFNLAFFVSSLIDFPVDIFRSDMIPAVGAALKNWAEQGNPYLPGETQGHPVYYGYLPGIFISHLPAWVLSVDLRWNNFLYRLFWLVFLNQLVLKTKRRDAALAFQFLAYSPYINFRHDLYFEGFILLLVTFFRFPSFRFLALPVMIITSQWSWVLAPFLFVNDWFQNPSTRLPMVLQYLLAGLTTLVFVAVILWDRASWPQMFRTVFWFQNVVGDSNFPYDYGLNFKFLFSKLGLLNWMQKIQAITVATIFFGVLTQKLRGPVLYWGAVALILFIMLNGHYWLYFWNIPIVFCVLLATTQDASADQLSWPSQVDPISK